jgi:hypothetical protein
MSDESGEPLGPVGPIRPFPSGRRDGTLSFEVLRLADELARARVHVTDRVRQRWGLVNSVYAALPRCSPGRPRSGPSTPTG